jgi:hypothetical protein
VRPRHLTLAHLYRHDYILTTPTGRNVTLNVCRSLSIDFWELKDIKEENVAAVVRRDHADFSMGYLNTTLQIRDDSPMLIYEDGSKCPKTDSMRGSTIIRFVCDSSASSPGSCLTYSHYCAF